MKYIDIFFDRLQRAVEIIAMVLLAAMTLLMIAAVFARYVLQGSVLYSEMFMVTFFAWLVLLLIGCVTRNDDHIRINVGAELFFRGRAKQAWATIENYVMLPLCIYLTWAGTKWIGHLIDKGLMQYTGNWLYPQWIPAIIVPIGLGVASLFYLERVIRQAASVLKWWRRRHAPYGRHEKEEYAQDG